jgi:hypothetical protein
MGLLNKSELLKTLRAIMGFDVNASPFAALELKSDEPCFYRSSHTGFIQSKNYGSGNHTHILLSHLRDSLQVLKDEAVELSLDGSGVLKLSSTDNVYESEIRVHTVRPEQAGLKTHNIGDIVHRLPAHVFQDFDARPFICAAQPTLIDGRIMMPTQSGIVVWQGPQDLIPLSLYPRETMLKFISSSQNLEKVVVSSKGYWGAVAGGLISFISGHTTGDTLYKSYNVSGKPLDTLPAERLIVSLEAAAGMCGDNKIEIDPLLGVVTRDTTGNQSRFAFGSHQGWSKFAITGRTAKVIADALRQSSDTDTALVYVPTNQSMRLVRGNWQVNFRTF